MPGGREGKRHNLVVPQRAVQRAEGLEVALHPAEVEEPRVVVVRARDDARARVVYGQRAHHFLVPLERDLVGQRHAVRVVLRIALVVVVA
jgi:hypothetical protein